MSIRPPDSSAPSVTARPAWRRPALGVLCLLANAPVAYKYAVRYGAPAWGAVAASLALIALAVALGPRLDRRLTRSSRPLLAYGVVALALAVAFVAAMKRFDPHTIRVARWLAIESWLGRFARGEYPYGSGELPSSFPFLFFIAWPFRALGDTGYLQIASFALFAVLCARARPGAGRPALRALLPLAVAPIFSYEVVTRSELFSNMTLVIALLAWLEHERSRPRGPLRRAAAGIAAGLLLCTRGIVALIYALALTARFKREIPRGIEFAAVCLASCAAVVLPFVVWDPARFLRAGPFAIQMSYIPGWLLGAAFLAAVALGLRARDSEDVFPALAFLLFAVVGLLFATAVASAGWRPILLGDRFDISYLAFAHTFAVYSLARIGEGSPSAAGT